MLQLTRVIAQFHFDWTAKIDNSVQSEWTICLMSRELKKICFGWNLIIEVILRQNVICFQTGWLLNAFSNDYGSIKHVKIHFVLLTTVFYRLSWWSILWHFACRQSGPCVSEINKLKLHIHRNLIYIKICVFISCWASYYNVPLPVWWRILFYQ